MVKPDVIITNPYGIDSPYWRYFIEQNRTRFLRIFIGMYDDHRKHDFREFLESACPWATFVDVGEIPGGEDWRNITVNACLDKSDAEWVLFPETDFTARPEFWNSVFKECENYDVVGYGDMGGWSEDIRLHPAFILVRREFVDKTSRDFGAYPEKNRDHFSIFTEELYKLFKKGELRFLDISDGEDRVWEHRKGLYSNYMRVLEGMEPNYEPKKFREHVKLDMGAPVPQDERFLEWGALCLKDSLPSSGEKSS